MKVTSVVLALGLGAALGGAAVAQAEDVPVTLAEALALADQANPELQAAAARVEAQVARTESVQRMKWPRLGLAMGWSRMDLPAGVFASKLNSGAVSFDTAGWDLGPYARQVQERVESNWRLPEAQSVLRQKGWVSIHFNVQKNGAITDLEVIRSSGIPSYDQSALNAMLSSNPLPPLPREVTLPKISGTFRFFFNMPIDDNAE